jgi:hypothetical protein
MTCASLCLILTPPITGFGLRLKDFGWNPSFLVELGCDSIPDDLVRLTSQVLGYSISYERFSSPPNLTSRAQVVLEIHGRVGDFVLPFSSSGSSVRAWSAVRLRGARQTAVLRDLREFVSCFVSIRWVGRFWLQVVGRTVRR